MCSRAHSATAIAVSAARADGTRIGLVSSERLYASGGIARWVAARAQLDADKPKFKVVESPDGKKPTPVISACGRRSEAPLQHSQD